MLKHNSLNFFLVHFTRQLKIPNVNFGETIKMIVSHHQVICVLDCPLIIKKVLLAQKEYSLLII